MWRNTDHDRPNQKSQWQTEKAESDDIPDSDAPCENEADQRTEQHQGSPIRGRDVEYSTAPHREHLTPDRKMSLDIATGFWHWGHVPLLAVILAPVVPMASYATCSTEPSAAT